MDFGIFMQLLDILLAGRVAAEGAPVAGDVARQYQAATTVAGGDQGRAFHRLAAHQFAPLLAGRTGAMLIALAFDTLEESQATAGCQ